MDGVAAMAMGAAVLLCAPAAHARPDLSGVYNQADIEESVKLGVEAPPDQYLDETRRPIASPPLTAWGEDQAARQKQHPEDDPVRVCMPQGTPRNWVGPAPIQVVQKTDVVVFLYEFMNKYRIVYMNDRPAPEAAQPMLRGRSTGRWEGETLVVKTTHFKGPAYLQSGLPKSDQFSLTERLSLQDNGRILRVEMRIEDPRAYKAPWYWVRHFRRVGWELGEYNCEENNRSKASDYDVLRNEAAK
jgi:hypothetical protein